VLSNFREPGDEVRWLIQTAADETERLLEEIVRPETVARDEAD
jgi:hypothetical protein